MLTTLAYSSSYYETDYADIGAFIVLILGIVLLPIIVIGILNIIAMWKIFTKAGEEGWKSIIPIYNTIVYFNIVGINPLFILLILVPGAGSILYFLVGVVASLRLAKGFNKSEGFAVGLILFGPIFQMILVFGKSDWSASRIDYDTFNFLNNEKAKAAASTAKPKTSASEAKNTTTAADDITTTPDDPWVEGKDVKESK